MKNDFEVKLYMSERRKGLTQQQAAARAGMSERTARKYEQAGALPSALKRPHEWPTRSNPFEEDWPWVVEQLERDPALQSTTLFALLCQRHPERYRPTQDRTLRRHIARWRALHGPEKDIIFEQVHTPGERAQSDFTHMEDLGVTIAGEPFPHLIYHFVLTYSNVEAASICFSETFEALAEGIEKALWQIGGVPQQHRTDHLSAAVRHLRQPEKEEWTLRYQGLMAHYGMQPTWNNTGVAHENGDVEQSHHRFKEAVDQALRVRASRDFATRAAYDHFVQNLIHKRNQTRMEKVAAEKASLRPLPSRELAPCKELRVVVSQFSTITIATNRYSVPSRLIGTTILVRVRSEHLEGYVGTTRVFEIPRLVGKHHHRIDYHHVIHALVRKPGAFAAYRYRDELFPTITFRQAYDRLVSGGGQRADREYVRLLHLAATTSETEVEKALQIVLEEHKLPSFLTVRDLVQVPTMRTVPALSTPELNLASYDQLIPSSLEGLCLIPPIVITSSKPSWTVSSPAFMAKHFADLALRAAKEGLSHEAYLHELARQEEALRQERRTERLLRASGLPLEKTFRTFDLKWLSPALQLQIERLKPGAFLEQAVNVVAIGKPGVGKSHVLAALGYELILAGHAVCWTPTSTLVQRLLAAKRDLRLPQELAKLDKYACVILDDIGYIQHDRDEMEVLFTFLSERYERKSVLISTNLVFSEWERIFKNPMTTMAAIDRVIHHCVILDMMAVDSYRAHQATHQHLPQPEEVQIGTHT